MSRVHACTILSVEVGAGIKIITETMHMAIYFKWTFCQNGWVTCTQNTISLSWIQEETIYPSSSLHSWLCSNPNLQSMAQLSYRECWAEEVMEKKVEGLSPQFEGLSWRQQNLWCMQVANLSSGYVLCVSHKTWTISAVLRLSTYNTCMVSEFMYTSIVLALHIHRWQYES